MNKNYEVRKSTRKDLMQVSPMKCVIKEGFNVRVDYGDIEALKNSIIAIGMQVPLKAKKVRGEDKWEVVDGHRRLMALQMAISEGHDIDFVDVSIFVGDDNERVISMLSTGVGQKSLNEIEQSDAVGRLLGKIKPEVIAVNMGKSIPHVYYLIKLNELPEKYKAKIREGYISGYLMLDLFENYSEEELDEELEKVINKAQEKSKDGEIKKATAKDHAEKPKKPIQKFADLIMYLDDNLVESEKASLAREIWDRINCDDTIDELIDIINS